MKAASPLKQILLNKLQEQIKEFQKQINFQKRQIPSFVKIVEVGPRDGLQNEKQIISTQNKLQLINLLNETGLQTIEVTSFVSPKWVPQMADASSLFKSLNKLPNINYPVLVPNIQGLKDAINVGVKEIAIFCSSSETFSQKNINCSIEESFKRFEKIVQIALQNNIKIRGYISTVLGCPYENEVQPLTVANISQRLFEMGCYEISLGDTIGKGTPETTEALLDAMKKFTNIPFKNIAMHFHDTGGKALQNILQSLQQGITIFDSSIGGLGGCPYAKSATGNICTENVAFMLQLLGIQTGLNLSKLNQAGKFITDIIKRENYNFFM